MSQPSPMVSVMSAARRGFDERHPAPRRHAVRLVRELLGPQLGEVMQHVLLQQLRVQVRHAVDRVAADAREIGHAHVALAVLVDERESRDARLVAEEAQARFVEEARVDFVHDLEMARQHLAERCDGPALERFRQQRVVGVAEACCARCATRASHSIARSSTSSRISSATAMDGCVSFI